jgi:hypothetical protein
VCKHFDFLGLRGGLCDEWRFRVFGGTHELAEPEISKRNGRPSGGGIAQTTPLPEAAPALYEISDIGGSSVVRFALLFGD